MSYRNAVQVTYARPYRRNDISASGTSATTGSAISANITLIHVRNDTGAKAYILPVATSAGAVTTGTGFPIPNGGFEYIKVAPGEYLAAILASSSGTIEVTEMTL